jgi:shikimate kinase
MNTPPQATENIPGLDRMIVLVGMMGAGKTTVGRRLAARLGLTFVDADREIEEAASCSIEDIFARHGEEAFRDGERRVIARLLDGPAGVLATGGGAYMSQETRDLIAEKGVAVWLRADLEVLLERVMRRHHRPLLNNGDPEGTLRRLIDERYPVYAKADITVQSGRGPHETVVDKIVAGLKDWVRRHGVE